MIRPAEKPQPPTTSFWGPLSRQLANAVLVIGVTFAALTASREARNAQTLEQQRFAVASDRVQREFEGYLRDHQIVLESARATLLASQSDGESGLATLCDALHLRRRFPAIGAVGSFRVPDGEPVHDQASARPPLRFEHFVQAQTDWPQRADVENSAEVAAEIADALHSTHPTTTRPLTIDGELCYLWTAPLAEPAGDTWVYAVISARTLVRQLATRCDPAATVQVADAPSGVLLTEPPAAGARDESLSEQRRVWVTGLSWLVTTEPSPAFHRERSTAATTFLIGGGLAVAVAVLIRVLAAARGRAERLALARTKELAEREAQVREEAERKELALAGGGLGLWDWHVQTGQVIYDTRTAEIVGETVDNLDPTIEGFKARVHPDDVEQIFEKVERHFNNPDEPYAADFRMRHRDGEYRWVHSRGKVTLRDSQGQPVRMTGTHIDVTDTRRLEQRLAQARKLESIGQLAAGVAHEINTPMQVVSSNLEFATQGFESLLELVNDLCEVFDSPPEALEERRAAVQRLVEQRRLAWLTTQAPNALLDAANAASRVVEIVRAMQAMSHPGQQDKAPTDVNALVQNATTLSRNRWNRCAELRLELAADAPAIPAFDAQLSQVVLNLVFNAADAIAQKHGEQSAAGRIVVRTVVEPDALRIEVEDNGPGVPQAIRERVFDPFFTTRDVGDGTGQGLSIAYDVVANLHNGAIEIDSTEGGGATFIVRLPLAGRDENVGVESELEHAGALA